MSTTAPAANAGWAGSIRPLAESTTTSGAAGRPSRARSSAKPAAAGGQACSGVQTDAGEAVSVPEPITSASAHARSSPITNRSEVLSPATSLFEPGTDGIATTPSMLATKFAKTRGLLEAERPAVERREPVGQVERGEAGRLEQKLEPGKRLGAHAKP